MFLVLVGVSTMFLGCATAPKIDAKTAVAEYTRLEKELLIHYTEDYNTTYTGSDGKEYPLHYYVFKGEDKQFLIDFYEQIQPYITGSWYEGRDGSILALRDDYGLYNDKNGSNMSIAFGNNYQVDEDGTEHYWTHGQFNYTFKK
jgi:hypothetical protein